MIIIKMADLVEKLSKSCTIASLVAMFILIIFAPIENFGDDSNEIPLDQSENGRNLTESQIIENNIVLYIIRGVALSILGVIIFFVTRYLYFPKINCSNIKFHLDIICCQPEHFRRDNQVSP